MRWFARAVALVLVVSPLGGGTAAAQGPSPFPDHWLTLDELAQILSLTAEQREAVRGPYTGLNDVLSRATQRRNELLAEFQGTRYSQLSASERQALEDRLRVIRADYDARQAELDQWLAAVRGQLTAAQQAGFDALAKPRLVPAEPPAGAAGP